MRLFKILIAAAILSLATVSASAAEISLVYDSQTKAVEISGSFDKTKRAVSLMILPSAVSKSSLAYSEINDKQYVTKQLLCGADGKFEVTLTMPEAAASDNYTVYAACGGETASTSFAHVSDSDILDVLRELNDADAKGIESILKTKYIKIGLALEHTAYAEEISGLLYGMRPASGYTLDDFPGELSRSTAIALIRGGKSIDDTIKQFRKAFNADYDTDIYSLDATAAQKLAEVIKNNSPDKSTERFFWQSYLYARVATSASYVAQGNVISRYAAQAELDVTTYNVLDSSAKNEVLSELYKKQPSSYADMASVFAALVANEKNKVGSSSGYSGGSGSSISFGSGDSAAASSGYVGFSDMENHWSRTYVENLSSKGIISGFEDNSFRPKNNVTRAEYAKMLVDALGIVRTYNTYFDDVTEDKWYYSYISAAKENGIVTGEGGLFKPMAEITRQDAAVMLYNAMLYKNAVFGEEKTFADSAEISDYAREAVGKLAGLGIISGGDAGFAPKSSTKRSEAAVMLSKLISYQPVINAAAVDFSEEYDLLAAISDAEKYIPADMTGNVTRGNFICALIGASGIGGVGADVTFDDVSAGSELYDFLSIAMKNKIVPEEKSFRPEEPITINEAAQLCVNITGYGVKAEKAGGFPIGYRSTASSIGILDGVHSGASLTAGDAYKIIFNTLNTEFLENVIVGSGEEYKVGKSTLLSEYLNIYKSFGVVTANEYTELGNTSEKGFAELKGTVGIDGKSYLSNRDFNDFIGYSVTAYIRYDKDNDEYEVISLSKKNDKEITLIGGELRYDNRCIYVDENGKEKKYKLDRSLDVIVNEKADYGYDFTSIDKLAGSITLIANNNSNEYNVAKVKSFDYMKINSYDKAKLTIRDWNNPSSTIELKEENISSIYIADESRYGTLGELETGTYIAAALSNDREMCEIVVLADNLSGIAESVSDDKITLDGQEYLMSEFFIKNDLRRLTIGKQVTLFSGVNSEAVAISYEDSTFMYAYMIWAKYNDEEDKVRVKLFTQYEDLLIYECAEKLKVDGVSGVLASDAYYNMLTSPQLIRFSLNNENKIKVIDLAEVKNDYSDKELLGLKDDNSLTRNKFAGGYYYRQSMFYPYFCIDNATVFKIPKNLQNENAFAIGYSFADGEVADGSFVEAYDVGYDGQAGAVVVNVDDADTASVSLSNAQIIVVERVWQTVDDDGDVRYAVSGWKDGKFVKYYTDAPTVLKFSSQAKIEPGDIIRVSLLDDTITAAVVDFIGESRTMNTGANVAASNCRSTACHYQHGQVYSCKNGLALIAWKKLSENEYSKDVGNMIAARIPDSVLVFDSENKKLRVADDNYISSYLNSYNGASYVVIQQDYGVSQFCVVYE